MGNSVPEPWLSVPKVTVNDKSSPGHTSDVTLTTLPFGISYKLYGLSGHSDTHRHGSDRVGPHTEGYDAAERRCTYGYF